jgi:N-acetylglucosamine kinase-like BadF-type ATPase
MLKYFIGIDGGGSGSRALLTDEQDNLVREAQGGGLNPLSLGWDSFRKNMADLLDQLLAQTPRESVAGLCAGLAGTGSEAVRKQAQTEISALLPGVQALVISDAQAALWGAFGGGAGLLLIAGTGSICLGMNGQGRQARSGGFGRLLGDEGGGYWISVEAIRWALKAQDAGATSSQLEAAIREEFRLLDLREVVPLVHESPPDRIAALARRILKLSGDDADAREIIHQAGDHLAALVSNTSRKLALTSVSVALWGGLWNSSGRELQGTLERSFERREMPVAIVAPAQSPTWGAIRYLRKELP